MGLDVYLYKYKDFKTESTLEKQFDAEVEELYADGITDEQRKKKKRELAKLLGIPKQDPKSEFSYGFGEKIEIDSAKYPEHYFKIGYLRSSYNGGGIDAVLRRMDLPSLKDVFNPKDEYEFIPNWEACLHRAKNLLANFNRIYNTEVGKYSCMFVGHNMFVDSNETVKSEQEAMKLFAEEFKKHTEVHKDADFNSYVNRSGEFHWDAMKVKAFMPGIGYFNQPGIYVVYENADKDWYQQALEITVEMCEWVLAQNDGQYILHWSS